jgi:hypothetical protein
VHDRNVTASAVGGGQQGHNRGQFYTDDRVEAAMPDPLEETQLNLEVPQWIAARRASGFGHCIHDAKPAVPRDVEPGGSGAPLN